MIIPEINDNDIKATTGAVEKYFVKFFIIINVELYIKSRL